MSDIPPDDSLAVAKIVTFYGFWQCQVAIYCIILHQLAAALPDNPEFGCTDRVAETRELVIAKKTPFIMPYRVDGQSLEILRIDQAAQRWPEVF